ncbi:MAG: hypothetical protein ACLPN5_00795 [Roseiarcus sp.]
MRASQERNALKEGLADFTASCRTTGAELVASKQEGGAHNFLIERLS